jgi:transposase
MEATMFSGWIYDHLKPHGAELKVAHPLMLRAIAAAKKKNDRIDANKICDCLRCDFLPECYMAPTAIRERRRTLRYRNLLVRQMVQMKIKTSTLMEAGVSYNKRKLHQAGYFRELLASNPDIHEGLRPLLRLCRETVVRLSKTENSLVSSLQQDPLLLQRVERLMSIPAIGPITALTWALEVGEVQRFSSIKKAISYCGLCGDEQRSANSVQRTPISKQRNKHLQTVLIEAAKMAPRYSPTLALLYDREKQKGMLIAQPPWHDRWRTQCCRSRPDPFPSSSRRRERLPRAGGSEKDYSARGLPGLAVKPTGHESASSRCSR